MPETESPPAEGKPKSPFAAALENFKGTPETPGGDGTDNPTKKEPPPKKEPSAKEPPAPEQKKGAPRELFKKPETAPTPTPAEPKSALDDIAAPEFKDEKSKKGWEALKAAGKDWETKYLALEKQNTERKTAGKDTETLETRIAELDKRLKESDEIVTRARLEDHPQFRAEFIDGRQKLVEDAKKIVADSGLDAKDIETALNLSGKPQADALSELAKEMSAFQSGRLGRVVDAITDLDERAAAKRADAKKAYDTLREQQRQQETQSAADQQKNRMTEFDNVARELSGTLEVLKRAEGHDEWNATAERIIRESRAHVEQHPGSNPRAEILARTGAVYRDLFVQADDAREAAEKERDQLKADLKKIHGKSPSLDGRRTATTPTGEKSSRPFSEKLAQLTSGE